MTVGLPTHLWVDPLRDDPRLQDLLHRMNFPERGFGFARAINQRFGGFGV